jgi:hypothetical protein
MMLTPSFLALLALVGTGRDEPDTIVLRTGKSIECRVVHETPEKVVYAIGTRTHEVARGDIEKLETVEISLREFLKRFEALDAKNTDALVDLAVWAEQSELPGEAHALWIRILTIDPDHERAWTKLGGVKGKKGWQLKVRGRFYDLAALRKRVSDWKNALELPTAHFLLKSDAEPERVLDLGLDVERAWCAFYDVFGPALGLYVFEESPEVHVFADERDYPKPPVSGQKAWFSAVANTLYVNAAAKPAPGDVLYQLTDLLVVNGLRRTADARTGQLEPWAREGFGQMFAAAVRPDPGRVKFEFEPPVAAWFRAQADDPKALTLSQTLRAGHSSFDSGPDAERFSRQCYTFLHFLVFTDGGVHRAKLAEYLRSAYLGKTGTANFEKAFGTQLSELEPQWVAYVKQIAGA